MTLIKKKYIREKGLLLSKGLIKGVFIPSKTDSVFYWTGKFDGTDLVNEVGTNIPLVSGTGLDAIYDFSGLNDDRLNKNAYLGNSFGLEEYYNYPYSDDIYFDTSNPYYWKLKDFHYANFLEQSLTVDNIAFLKAKATTNTSNILANVSGLVIYNTALVNSNLTKTKGWIGIQADFYGDNIIVDYDLDNPTYWTLGNGALIQNGTAILKHGAYIRQDINNYFNNYRIEIDILQISTVVRVYKALYNASENITLYGTGIFTLDLYSSDYSTLVTILSRNEPNLGETSIINSIKAFPKYINYYKQ